MTAVVGTGPVRGRADELGLCRLWLRLGDLSAAEGRYADALASSRRALTQARRIGAVEEGAVAARLAAASLRAGPVPAGVAIRRCRSLLRRDEPPQGAVVDSIAVLLATRGRLAEARALASERAPGCPCTAAMVEVFADRLDRAEELLRTALAGDGSVASSLAARRLLARVLVATDRVEDADRLLRGLVDGGAVPTGPAVVVAELCGTVARLLARRDEPARAGMFASIAVVTAGRTDSPGARAVAHLDRADVLARTGQRAAAGEATRRAARYFAAKGHAVGAGWAGSLSLQP